MLTSEVGQEENNSMIVENGKTINHAQEENALAQHQTISINNDSIVTMGGEQTPK